MCDDDFKSFKLKSIVTLTKLNENQLKKKTNLVSALISAFSVTSIRYGWPNIPKEIPQFRTFISLFTIFIIHTE